MYYRIWYHNACSRLRYDGPALILRLLTAKVTTYGGLLATRFFLGLAEAGIFPGSLSILVSCDRRPATNNYSKAFTLLASGTSARSPKRASHYTGALF